MNMRPRKAWSGDRWGEGLLCGRSVRSVIPFSSTAVRSFWNFIFMQTSFFCIPEVNVGQVAYDAKTGEMIEAFSVTDTEWTALCSAPKGAILMPRSGWPAVPKTSIRGLRFFAHQPGYSGALPKPESYAHTRLKIDIVKAARKLGYLANIEVAGSAPNGNNWIADVLVDPIDGKKTAFEVQLSSQHLHDFRDRTERYRQSSVECCWVISEKPVGVRLAKALAYENIEYNRQHREFQVDDEGLLTFGVHFQNKDTYPDESPYLRFSRGPELRGLSIPEAIEGMSRGRPHWRKPFWSWRD